MKPGALYRFLAAIDFEQEFSELNRQQHTNTPPRILDKSHLHLQVCNAWGLQRVCTGSWAKPGRTEFHGEQGAGKNAPVQARWPDGVRAGEESHRPHRE